MTKNISNIRFKMADESNGDEVFAFMMRHFRIMEPITSSLSELINNYFWKRKKGRKKQDKHITLYLSKIYSDKRYWKFDVMI